MLDLRSSRPDHPDAVAMTEEVQQWYVEIYGGRDDDPLVPAEFVAPEGSFLIGYEDGVPVAMGGWTRTAPPSRDVKVRRMYVRPAAQRRGYAALLLDALEAEARAVGATRVVLSTGEPQEAAVRFYRSRGYADVEPFGFYAGFAQAVHLGKPL